MRTDKIKNGTRSILFWLAVLYFFIAGGISPAFRPFKKKGSDEAGPRWVFMFIRSMP